MHSAAATNSEAAPAITITTTDYHTAGEPFRIVTGDVGGCVRAGTGDRADVGL